MKKCAVWDCGIIEAMNSMTDQSITLRLNILGE